MKKLNTVICGDNLQVLKQIRGKVNLVYLDPPFAAGSEYRDSKSDVGSVEELIKMLRLRIMMIRELLADNGSIYCHCDWRTEAYFQVLLDEVFGRQNLIAKIIWQRSNKTSSLQRFLSHTYDVILFYGKSSRVKFVSQYQPYSDNEIDSLYKYIEEETGKHYRLVNLTSPDGNPSKFNFEFLGVKRNWRIPKEKMEEEFKQGRIVQSKPGAIPMRKQYMNEGKLIGDVWADINVSSVAKEKTGYPTQKPLALLERILQMSTEKGDIVLDPFCGSGTTLVAAEKLGRKWIGIDNSPSACEIAIQRIQQIQKTTSIDLLQLQGSRTLKEVQNMPYYEFESWALTSLASLLRNNPKFSESIGLKRSPLVKVYSIAKDLGFDMELEGKENSIPVMVKQKTKIDSKEINNFAIQLKHHSLKRGLFIALSFSKNALEEIGKKRIDGFEIIPILTKDILSESTYDV